MVGRWPFVSGRNCLFQGVFSHSNLRTFCPRKSHLKQPSIFRWRENEFSGGKKNWKPDLKKEFRYLVAFTQRGQVVCHFAHCVRRDVPNGNSINIFETDILVSYIGTSFSSPCVKVSKSRWIKCTAADVFDRRPPNIPTFNLVFEKHLGEDMPSKHHQSHG